jgi:hypothetical protein
METKAIIGEQGLQIILRMISIANNEPKDDSKGWLVWGSFYYTRAYCCKTV